MLREIARPLSIVCLVFAQCAPPPTQPVPLVGEDDEGAAQPLADERTTTDDGWPRTVAANGVRIIMHQPQVESWENNRLRSRSAVAVETSASGVPVFGVVTLSARTNVDRENRLVMLDDIRVDDARFPSNPDRADEYAALIRKNMPTTGVYVALDRLTASLAVTRAESQHPTVHVKNDVPRILFSSAPALLVLVDGEPVLRAASGTKLMRVINTRALLVLDPQSGEYWLDVAGHWMRSKELGGAWSEAREIPAPLALDLDRVKEATTRDKLVDLLDTAGSPVMDDLARGVVPTITTSTTPAELIQTRGKPEYQPIADTSLLELTNTTSDVFLSTTDQRHYALLSGRWFKTTSLERGPWEFVSAKTLPADFARIPESHPKGTVLASVPNTPDAQQALIANDIPQTAMIERATPLSVVYDGAPKWAPIEGTTLAYARNSATPVIRVADDSYYAVDSGVWFVSASPLGPWAVATTVPDAIYAIPASSPIYYVTYVHVYESTPELVYEGYTPGYLGAYVSDDDVVVYGTGYVYPCWADEFWIGSPWTFGFDVGWAPGFFWGFGWGYGVGLGLGVWPGMLYHPWWGPGGWGWGRRNAVVRNYHETNLYRQTWSSHVRANAWERNAPSASAPMRGPIGGFYAGHNGEVYRARPSGAWERSTPRGWERAQPPREIYREHDVRQINGTHWQQFRNGGGFRGGGFHGGHR